MNVYKCDVIIHTRNHFLYKIFFVLISIKYKIKLCAFIISENSLARIEKRTQQSAFIRFNPSEKQQKEISEYGVYGQFVVQYDVRRDASGGEMRVRSNKETNETNIYSMIF